MRRRRTNSVLVGLASLVLLLVTACPDPTTTVTVPVSYLSLSESSASLLPGETLQLSATVSPVDASNPAIVWSCDMESIATVSADGLVTALTAGTAVITVSAEDGTVNATCSIRVLDTFTVAFNSNDGFVVTSLEVVEGNTFTRPADPVKEGFVFDGWYEDEALSEAWDFAVDVVSMDMTLHAKWSLPTFTVSFNTNGAPSVIGSQSVESGGTVAFPGAPGRDGYGFAGWYADSDLTDEWNFSVDTVTGDMTLYVKWNLSVYYIVYNKNGGTLAGETTSYTIQSADITLVEPTKSGSVFAGWYEDSGFAGEAVTVIHAGSYGYKEYYAKWLATVTISFDANGGTGSMATQEAVEAIAEALDTNGFTPPASNGFAGWSTDENATEAEYTDGADFIAGSTDITLYAVWKSWYNYEVLADGTTISLKGFSDYYDDSEALVIPASIDGYTVKKILDNAFGYNRQITSIVFPDTLTEIGYGAFQYNSSLASITLGSSLSSISGNAFTYTAISTVRFPASLEYLTTTAFRNCSSFTAYTVETGNTKFSASNGILYNLDKTTVYHCPLTKTGSFDIPSTVTRINQYAYENCSQLENLTLPAGLIEIGYSAFQNCDSIESVTIPEGVSSLTSDVFRGCDALESVQLPASLTSLASDRAFIYTPSLSSITVAAGNTHYASVDGVLYNAEKTTLLTFPAAKDALTHSFPVTLESLNDYAFSGYQGESIVVPEGVTTMGYGVFIAIESTTLTFPSTITSIGSQLAVNSNKLATIIINATTAPSLGQFAPFGRSNAAGLQVKVPASSVSDYESASDWVALDVAQYVVSQ